ncbi:MAG: deoxyribonuclease IV [Bacilli bacterium]|nr:deoxyribonuclease IV [Bacilli bacterium]
MLIIGSHVKYNSKDQIMGSLNEALDYNENCFMFYTGAPQNTMRSKIDENICNKAKEKMKEVGINIENVIAHAPYIINLANNKEEAKYRFSINFLKEELNRCTKIGIKYIVLHPGSHVGLGEDIAIENISKALNEVLEESKITILLETMAGKGSEVGKTFEQLSSIIQKVENKDKIGICMDTCHLNDAGYDVRSFDKILDEFDQIVGIKYLKCIHINDSKNPLASHKDRHENIGYGTLGFNTLIDIIYNKRLESIPKILETPYIEENPPYKEEIEMIRNKQFKELTDK